MAGRNVVEWDEEILLPARRSVSISFKVHMSFELGSRVGNGALLCTFRTTAANLDLDKELKPIGKSHKKVLRLDPSLKVITEGQNFSVNGPVTRFESDATSHPKQLTASGHRALLLYRQSHNPRDLDEAVTCFEHVRNSCPPDEPSYSAVLFNFATAMFIRCQAHNHCDHLDDSVTLYQKSLGLCASNHKGRCVTALDLCFALLARLQRRVDDAGMTTKDSPSSAVEHYAYGAAWVALQMAGIAMPMKMINAGISQGDGTSSEIESLVQMARDMMRGLSDRHPVWPAALASLGTFLLHRFERSHHLVDIHEAISVSQYAVHLTPDGHPDKPSWLDQLGVALYCRFERLRDPTDLHKSIPWVEEAVRLTPQGHRRESNHLYNLAKLLCGRYDLLGDLMDLNKSISKSEDAVRLSPLGHPDRSDCLNNLSNSLARRFERLKDITDMNRAVSLKQEVVRLTPDSDLGKPARLNALGTLFYGRFQHIGHLADINQSIPMFEDSIHLTPDGIPEKPTYLNNLASSLCDRFGRLGDLEDIHKSISTSEDAIHLTPHGHPSMPSRLYRLADALFHRFQSIGDLTDLNKSISKYEKVVDLTLDKDLNKPSWLNDFGISLRYRFEHLGDPMDINKSISILEKALHLTAGGYSDRPSILQALGSSLLCRFEHLGDIADVNRSIAILGDVVHLASDGHAKKLAPLNSLGCSFFRRFTHTGDLSDIQKSILALEEAVHVAADDDPNKSDCLTNLGNSLCHRFQALGDIADINKAISVLEEVVHSTPDSKSGKPVSLSSLGDALSCRFVHSGDPADLNKSITMFEEALRLTPDDHPSKAVWLNNLANSLGRRFELLGASSDINEAILMSEKALSLTPNDNPRKSNILNSLGNSLACRFRHLGDLIDINKSISMFEKALSLMSSGSSLQRYTLKNLANSLSRRFQHIGDLPDIDRAIEISEEVVNLTSDGNPDKPTCLSNLSSALFHRFDHLGDLSDLNKSISLSEQAVKLTPEGHPSKPNHLNNLGVSLSQRFEVLGNLSDINKAISASEEAVCLTPDSRYDKPDWVNNLGHSLSIRFGQLGNLADIERSVLMFEETIEKVPDGHPTKAGCLYNLGISFMKYYEHLHDASKLSAAMSYFSLASHASAASTLIRFHATRWWISAAHLQDDSQNILDAYATSISLLPQLAWLGLPPKGRHRLLVEAADTARDADAAALETGFPDKAVEWLEQGRSVVWTQFLQLRSPVDELRVEHPILADQFQRISEELERMGSRSDNPMSDSLVTNTVSGILAQSRVEEEAQKHHDLALKREKLLDDIRSLLGFDRFLLPKPVKQLAAFAKSGPVVYLNASKHRCDALIVQTEQRGVIHVPLHGVKYRDVKFLFCLLLKRQYPAISRDDISKLIPSEAELPSQHMLDMFLMEDGVFEDLVTDRDGNLRPGGYTPDDRLRGILSFLWKKVVNPVLDALGLSTPTDDKKLTRIFWCPTGPFAFLPIHAAGLYDTTEPGTKLSDFAISSYIPNLGSLAPPSGRKEKHSSSNIHLVAVPQPSNDGQIVLTCVKREIDHIKRLASFSPFVTVHDSDGTVEDVMEKMKTSDWVHFACHGVQDPTNPLDSGLCLADERLLTLSDIIKLSRPQGGLAFLSACQTAKGDEHLSEESVHLAAGMLLAGYGGVIATMWSIMDQDAPKVTQSVYERLFKDNRAPDTTEAAEALHHAVQNLRKSGVSFLSWVPFIHVGR